MPLNSLIFYDDIDKMNCTLEDAWKGANDVGRMLESKQLKANTSKSKFVIIGQKQSRTELLKEPENNPIKMGQHNLENSESEKYLGNQIQEDGTAASITETLKYLKYAMTHDY